MAPPPETVDLEVSLPVEQVGRTQLAALVGRQQVVLLVEQEEQIRGLLKNQKNTLRGSILSRFNSCGSRMK